MKWWGQARRQGFLHEGGQKTLLGLQIGPNDYFTRINRHLTILKSLRIILIMLVSQMDVRSAHRWVSWWTAWCKLPNWQLELIKWTWAVMPQSSRQKNKLEKFVKCDVHSTKFKLIHDKFKGRFRSMSKITDDKMYQTNTKYISSYFKQSWSSIS